MASSCALLVDDIELTGQKRSVPDYLSGLFHESDRVDAPGEHFYGWAGWNHAQRVQAIAAIYTDGESRHGWPVPQLVPLLAGVHEELPWVLQWHAELGVRLGDYFREWLGAELQKHSLTPEDVERWRPERVTRRRRRA